MKVSELREALRGVSDDLEVFVEIQRDEDAGEWDDLPQATLRSVTVESRCADEASLFLFGSIDEDEETS